MWGRLRMALTRRKDLKFVEGRGFVSIDKKKSSSSSSNKTYNVYDEKGNLVRVGTFGDSIADAQLKARAATVEKNIGSSNVSEQEAKQGNAKNKFNTNLAKLITESKKPQEKTTTKQLLNNAGLGFLSKTMTESQLKRLINNNQLRSSTGLPIKIERELDAIDRRKDLKSYEKQALKEKALGINQKPVDFNKIVKANNNNQKNKNLAELIKLTPTEAIAKKVQNGETLTPSQQQSYSNYINKQANELTAAQLKLLKNAPKNIGIGLWEVGVEVVTFPVDVVVGAFNYGRNAVTRSEKTGRKDIFAQDAKKALNKFANFTGKVSGFIIENPKEAAIITGVAASAGAGIAMKSFAKNPVKSLTKATAYIFSGQILKYSGKAVTGSVKTISNLKRMHVSKETRLIKNIASLEKDIIRIEDLGINVRQKTKQAQYLRNARAELGLMKDELKVVSSSVDEINGIILSSSKKQPQKTVKAKIKLVEKKIKSNETKINRIKTKREKLRKQRQKLTDVKKSELIGKFFKDPNKKVKIKKNTNTSTGGIRIKKNIANNENKIISDLKDARKKGGDTFSKLKKKIKKDYGLNVVERKDKLGNIQYKLLEPKTNRKAGISTGKKSKPKVINIGNSQKTKIPYKKITKKDNSKSVIDITKELEKEGIIVFSKSTKVILNSKKGQVGVARSMNRGYKKINKQYSNVKKKIVKIKNQYKKLNAREKDLTRKTKGSKQKDIQTIRNKKKRLNEKVSELNKEKLKINKKLSKLLKANSKLSGMSQIIAQDTAQAQSQLQQQIQDINNDIAQIQKLKQAQINKPGKSQKPNNGTSGNKTKPKTISKTDLKKISDSIIKPKTKPRTKPKKTPPQKPIRKIKIPDIKLRSLKPGERYVYNAVYVEGGKEKQLQIKLPLNAAKQAAAVALDNTIQQTIVRFREVGITKKKDLKASQTLKKKFSKSKTKNGLTEKRKYAIDKAGEKGDLKLSKYAKTSLSKVVSDLKKKINEANKKKKTKTTIKKKKTTNKKKTTVKKKSTTKKKTTAKKKITVKKKKTTKIKPKVKKTTKKPIKKAVKKKVVKKKAIKKRVVKKKKKYTNSNKKRKK